MHRVLIPPQAIEDAEIVIREPETLHQLLNVLRVRIGERLGCFDGQGRWSVGVIVRCHRRAVVVAVDQRGTEPPPSLRVTLAQALIKPDRFEWVIEKATELGVVHIIPLVTSRTVVRESSRATGGSRLTRWRRIIEFAAAQCGRSTVPSIASPTSLADVLQHLEGRPGFLLTPAEHGTALAECVRTLGEQAEMTIFIGPEGDFSPEEIVSAKQVGIRIARLGPVVLRSETAALAALVILQHTAGVL